MYTTLIASASLLASTALASSIGSAIVTNGCKYDVHLFNTPSANGGATEIDQVLSPGKTYTQPWTSLTNGNGWSLKLSKSASLDNILQYEYTFHNDGIIWFDLSEVNGNPWNANWEITATGDPKCSPKQQAYRYATDDAYGMQSCNQDASVTVLLCSGESQNDGAAASASVSAASQTGGQATSVVAQSSTSQAAVPPPSSTTHSSTAVAVVPTSSAAPPVSSTTLHTTSSVAPVAPSSTSVVAQHSTFDHRNPQNVVTTSAATTLATSTLNVVDVSGHVVTEVETAVVTQYVTQTMAAAPGKRHVHHPGHPNFRV